MTFIDNLSWTIIKDFLIKDKNIDLSRTYVETCPWCWVDVNDVEKHKQTKTHKKVREQKIKSRYYKIWYAFLPENYFNPEPREGYFICSCYREVKQDPKSIQRHKKTDGHRRMK